MKKILGILSLVVSVLLCAPSHADPLEGLLKITGGFFGSSSPVTGDFNGTANTLSLNSTFVYGLPATFVVSELLPAGVHTKSYTLSSGATLTRTETIPSGKVGGYFVIETNGSWYQIFNAWNVSTDGRSYSAVNFSGNIFSGGPLSGKRGNLEFTVPPPPAPTMSLSVDVVGGATQECTSPGGATVALTADATIVGNTTLDRVDWYVDSVFAGSGNAVNLLMPVGPHVVQAVGIATDGITSASADANVEVKDTTAPALEIRFLNNAGQQVTTATVGNYSVQFVVSDACDPNPVVTASAKPVMNVSDGDTITINSTSDVQLPTTAVEVSASARDVNGRVGLATATLAIQ